MDLARERTCGPAVLRVLFRSPLAGRAGAAGVAAGALPAAKRACDQRDDRERHQGESDDPLVGGIHDQKPSARPAW